MYLPLPHTFQLVVFPWCDGKSDPGGATHSLRTGCTQSTAHKQDKRVPPFEHLLSHVLTFTTNVMTGFDSAFLIRLKVDFDRLSL